MALLMAALIWLTMIVISALFMFGPWTFPELISEYGNIDSQFKLTLIVTGIAFILSHLALGYYILCWLMPHANVLHLPLPGVEAPAQSPPTSP